MTEENSKGMVQYGVTQWLAILGQPIDRKDSAPQFMTKSDKRILLNRIKHLPTLAELEEKRVAEVLYMIRKVLELRHLPKYPLFNGSDRSKAYTRSLMPSQFGRVLDLLDVSPEDSKLLCRKFADATMGGNINYTVFTQIVEFQWLGCHALP